MSCNPAASAFKPSQRTWLAAISILQKHVYTVPDPSQSLFSTNPAVAGPPHFRFYSGAPVFDPNGFPLGSICVMDYEPHEINESQKQTLLALAAVASDEVKMRVAKRSSRPGR